MQRSLPRFLFHVALNFGLKVVALHCFLFSSSRLFCRIGILLSLGFFVVRAHRFLCPFQRAAAAVVAISFFRFLVSFFAREFPPRAAPFTNRSRLSATPSISGYFSKSISERNRLMPARALLSPLDIFRFIGGKHSMEAKHRQVKSFAPFTEASLVASSALSSISSRREYFLPAAHRTYIASKASRPHLSMNHEKNIH